MIDGSVSSPQWRRRCDVPSRVAGKVYLGDYTTTSNVVAESSVSTVNNGQWRHVAIVQSVAGNYLKIYIDGVEDYSLNGYYTGTANSRYTVVGGARGNSASWQGVYTGSLCMPTLIIGTALTAANIQDLAGL